MLWCRPVSVCQFHTFYFLFIHSFLFIVWFQKISIPPPRREFHIQTPPPRIFHFQGILLTPPPPPPFPHPFRNSSNTEYTPTPIWNFLGHLSPPPPTTLEFPIPSVVGVWIFSGTTHCILHLIHAQTTYI